MTNTVSEIVSDETLDCIIQIESAGNPRAKASTSSALGLFQFLNATWLGTVQKHRPDVFASMNREALLLKRTDVRFCIEMGARFTEDNLKAIGRDATGGDLYLAHFLGVGDARKLYRADEHTPVSELIAEGPIRANESILRGKTAGEVRLWAAKKMAKNGGKGWIAKYYGPPKVVPLPRPRPQEDIEDIPDPQDAPIVAKPPAAPPPTVVVPADAPPKEVEKRVEQSAARDAEPGPSWIKRQWGKLTGVLGGFLGMGTGFVFDWRLMTVILVSMFMLFIFLIWFMGPGSVREWIRKQVQ